MDCHRYASRAARVFGSVCLLSLVGQWAAAQNNEFQIIVTVTPPGSNTNPASWQDVQRFMIAGTGGAAFPLSNIPKTQVFDPAGLAFQTDRNLYIGNRHGNVLGQGSISRFELSLDGQTANYIDNFTTPGMVGVHELDFSPATGELFVSAVANGIFRFKFSGQTPAPNGQIAAGTQTRGVMVSPLGNRLYVTSASNTIRQFAIAGDGSISPLTTLFPPGASNLHFFGRHPEGDIYVCDISQSRVYGYEVGAFGELNLRYQISSPGAVDCTFSPDGLEMYVGNHFSGGISRYLYDADADAWVANGLIATPSMGGFGTYAPPPHPVSGTVQLQDWFGAVEGTPVVVQFRHATTGQLIRARNAVLAADGSFSVITALTGTYRVAVKAPRWLRGQRTGVVIDGTGASGLEFSLLNGDCDGDNTVTVFDYAVLSDAFDTMPGDAKWDERADLDGDGSVTVFDYAILSQNFDKTGA